MDETRGGHSELDLLRADLEQVRRERDALAGRIRELEQQSTAAANDALSPPTAVRFDDAFRVEQSRAKRQRLALSLALVELDNLQGLRDRLEHAAGEGAFARLGVQLEASLRPTDVVCRVDGLAWGILLTATNLEQALAAVSRLQQHVSEQPFATQNVEIELSFSAGIVQWRTDESLGDLLSRASRALGLAKKAGTAKIVVG